MIAKCLCLWHHCAMCPAGHTRHGVPLLRFSSRGPSAGLGLKTNVYPMLPEDEEESGGNSPSGAQLAAGAQPERQRGGGTRGGSSFPLWVASGTSLVLAWSLREHSRSHHPAGHGCQPCTVGQGCWRAGRRCVGTAAGGGTGGTCWIRTEGLCLGKRAQDRTNYWRGWTGSGRAVGQGQERGGM